MLKGALDIYSLIKKLEPLFFLLEVLWTKQILTYFTLYLVDCLENSTILQWQTVNFSFVW